MKSKPSKMHANVIPVETHREEGSDIEPALGGIATAAAGIAEELRPLYHLDAISDHIANLASALGHLANAVSLSVIAKNGTEEERNAAVKYAKRGLEGFDEE